MQSHVQNFFFLEYGCFLLRTAFSISVIIPSIRIIITDFIFFQYIYQFFTCLKLYPSTNYFGKINKGKKKYYFLTAISFYYYVFVTDLNNILIIDRVNMTSYYGLLSLPIYKPEPKSFLNMKFLWSCHIPKLGFQMFIHVPRS